MHRKGHTCSSFPLYYDLNLSWPFWSFFRTILLLDSNSFSTFQNLSPWGAIIIIQFSVILFGATG
jgi:hypothetical protein